MGGGGSEVGRSSHAVGGRAGRLLHSHHRYKERKEDTDTIFDQAIKATSVVFLYASPLLGTWLAPQHPFLSPEREAKGRPPDPWRRKGPSSITRAWCLFEVTESLLAGNRLQVEGGVGRMFQKKELEKKMKTRQGGRYRCRC